jgi:hypothetical protein
MNRLLPTTPLQAPFFFILFLGMLFFISIPQVRAQNINTHKWLSFPSDAISADNGELMDIRVRIDNWFSQKMNVSIKITADEELELVSKSTEKITIVPQQGFFVSFRVLVPQRTIAQDRLRLLFELKDSSGQLIESRYLYVNINATKNITMFMIEPNLVIRERNEKMLIPIRIHNRGNTTEELTIVTNFPFLEEAGALFTKTFTIHPFADTIINVERVVSKQMLQLNQFNVSISAVYENGDIAGLGSVVVQSLRSSKSYTENMPNDYYYDAPYNHSIEVGVQYLLTPYESYTAKGGSDLFFNNTKITYNFDAQFWKKTYSDPYLRNTYLQFEHNNIGLIVGSVTRNYDINLTGRGAAAYVRDTAHGSYYEVGAMDESYNLVGKSNYSGIENNKSAWANFAIKKTSWSFASVLIQQTNNLEDSRYSVSSNEFKWIRKKFKASAIADISYTKTNTSNNSIFAGAGGFSMNGEWGKVAISSENFISSPYYPGLKRGTRNFSERISLTNKKLSLWGSYSNYNYEPKYLDLSGLSSTTFTTNKAELGLSGKFSEDFAFSVSPVYYHETNSYATGASSLNAEIKSLGSAFQLNYFNNARRQYLYINSEAGIYQAPLTGHTDNTPHFKTSATVKYDFFSLNVYAQWGAFYAGDILSEHYQSGGATRIINITPLVEAGFFKKRLMVLAGVTYTENNFSGDGWQVTGRADYGFARNYKMYVSFMKYRYDINDYEFTDARIGLIRDLPVTKITTNQKTMTVFIYKDINNNNEYDKGDSVASGFQAEVNKNIFVSGDNGKIFYKGLPDGIYSVSAPSMEGWYAPEQEIRFSGKSTIAIALHRTSVLVGEIVYEEQTAIVYDVEKKKNNISVYATSVDGRYFYTQTGDNGRFFLYLPPGEYDIEIKDEDRPEQIECSNCKQFVRVQSGVVNKVQFIFSVKERVVKLQKFISPSLEKP